MQASVSGVVSPPSMAGVIVSLQEQISSVKGRISRINDTLLYKSSSQVDNAFDAVHADDERGYWEGKLAELENFLQSCVSVSLGECDEIRIGSVLELRRDDGKTFVAILTESADLLVGQKCLSVNTPLGAAVLGKSSGDIVQVDTVNGKQTYEVIRCS